MPLVVENFTSLAGALRLHGTVGSGVAVRVYTYDRLPDTAALVLGTIPKVVHSEGIGTAGAAFRFNGNRIECTKADGVTAVVAEVDDTYVASAFEDATSAPPAANAPAAPRFAFAGTPTSGPATNGRDAMFVAFAGGRFVFLYVDLAEMMQRVANPSAFVVDVQDPGDPSTVHLVGLIDDAGRLGVRSAFDESYLWKLSNGGVVLKTSSRTEVSAISIVDIVSDFRGWVTLGNETWATAPAADLPPGVKRVRVLGGAPPVRGVTLHKVSVRSVLSLVDADADAAPSASASASASAPPSASAPASASAGSYATFRDWTVQNRRLPSSDMRPARWSASTTALPSAWSAPAPAGAGGTWLETRRSVEAQPCFEAEAAATDVFGRMVSSQMVRANRLKRSEGAGCYVDAADALFAPPIGLDCAKDLGGKLVRSTMAHEHAATQKCALEPGALQRVGEVLTRVCLDDGPAAGSAEAEFRARYAEIVSMHAEIDATNASIVAVQKRLRQKVLWDLPVARRNLVQVKDQIVSVQNDIDEYRYKNSQLEKNNLDGASMYAESSRVALEFLRKRLAVLKGQCTTYQPEMAAQRAAYDAASGDLDAVGARLAPCVTRALDPSYRTIAADACALANASLAAARADAAAGVAPMYAPLDCAAMLAGIDANQASFDARVQANEAACVRRRCACVVAMYDATGRLVQTVAPDFSRLFGSATVATQAAMPAFAVVTHEQDRAQSVARQLPRAPTCVAAIGMLKPRRAAKRFASGAMLESPGVPPYNIYDCGTVDGSRSFVAVVGGDRLGTAAAVEPIAFLPTAAAASFAVAGGAQRYVTYEGDGFRVGADPPAVWANGVDYLTDERPGYMLVCWPGKIDYGTLPVDGISNGGASLVVSGRALVLRKAGATDVALRTCPTDIDSASLDAAHFSLTYRFNGGTKTAKTPVPGGGAASYVYLSGTGRAMLTSDAAAVTAVDLASAAWVDDGPPTAGDVKSGSCNSGCIKQRSARKCVRFVGAAFVLGDYDASSAALCTYGGQSYVLVDDVFVSVSGTGLAVGVGTPLSMGYTAGGRFAIGDKFPAVSAAGGVVLGGDPGASWSGFDFITAAAGAKRPGDVLISIAGYDTLRRDSSLRNGAAELKLDAGGIKMNGTPVVTGTFTALVLATDGSVRLMDGETVVQETAAPAAPAGAVTWYLMLESGKLVLRNDANATADMDVLARFCTPAAAGFLKTRMAQTYVGVGVGGDASLGERERADTSKPYESNVFVCNGSYGVFVSGKLRYLVMGANGVLALGDRGAAAVTGISNTSAGARVTIGGTSYYMKKGLALTAIAPSWDECVDWVPNTSGTHANGDVLRSFVGSDLLAAGTPATPTTRTGDDGTTLVLTSADLRVTLGGTTTIWIPFSEAVNRLVMGGDGNLAAYNAPGTAAPWRTGCNALGVPTGANPCAFSRTLAASYYVQLTGGDIVVRGDDGSQRNVASTLVQGSFYRLERVTGSWFQLETWRVPRTSLHTYINREFVTGSVLYLALPGNRIMYSTLPREERPPELDSYSGPYEVGTMGANGQVITETIVSPGWRW